jgi:glycosyltransferase involved in cell wall biosynthesis
MYGEDYSHAELAEGPTGSGAGVSEFRQDSRRGASISELSARRRSGAAALPEPRSPLRTLSPARERPIVYDLSHLIARLRAQTGTGIDRIDLAFATHFLCGATPSQSARYGLGPPQMIGDGWAQRFIGAAQRVWLDDEGGRAEALWSWLGAPAEGAAKPRVTPRSRVSGPAWRRRLLSWSGSLAGNRRRAVPQDAVYVNVGYHRFEHPRFFAWLGRRPDVAGVFMIHDLLPLDYPEYFAPGEADTFRTRIGTALRYGRAFLVSTEAVRRRLEREIAERGLAPRPIWARPFPSPLADLPRPASHLTRHPYFVVVGTLEPRKNHLLLLHLWRELARGGATPPRLVIVGKRGWENEQVLDLLDRSAALAPHVLEMSDLSSRDLAALISGARALLAPSFDEGYGLPIVEALALGTPVVASESEAAREVSQGRATLLSPIDGAAWRREIERLAGDDAYQASQRARACGFVAPNWRDYFAALDAFLANLPAGETP